MANLLPYREVTDDRYAVAGARFTPSRPARGSLVLTGPCPRCETVIQVPVVDGVFKAPLRRRSGPTPVAGAAERVEAVVCTCTEPHPDRPADRVGCGAYWLLRITVDDS